MKIKLKHHEDLGDWYSIVRAEHDGREWWHQVSKNSHQYMMSERLSPEACIEGSACEMLVVADAIRRRSSVSFKRVEVRYEEGAFIFCSPKNSKHEVLIPVKNAEELALEIYEKLNHELKKET
jgi:hypothetical protein